VENRIDKCTNTYERDEKKRKRFLPKAVAEAFFFTLMIVKQV
jgi:hypothetical protein